MTAPSITTIDATTTVTTTVVVPPPASKPQKETPEEKEQQTVTHQLLARQLEYYFSTGNLARDTYLSTLRDLNDSYVPVSIIANFGKVQALAPFESALEAVIEAATEHSDLLEIVELDEEGKKITSTPEEKDETEQQATVTILAVGPITGKPIPMSQISKMEKPNRAKNNASPSITPAPALTPVASPTSGSSGSNVQNTIILREVAKEVDEETLRNLFDFESCPSIESIREDLHNCWFVTLTTSSKDDMFNVMMKLRMAKFPSGDSVKARLKSSASASLLTPNAVVYVPNLSSMYGPQFNSNNGGSSNSRKKRGNNKGRGSNNSGANGNIKSKNTQQNGGNASKRRNSKDMTIKPTLSNDGSKTRTKKMTPKAPSMGVSNFPSLPPTSDGNKPFQVEKVPMDDEMLRDGEKERRSVSGFSDSSSTATSSTASTPTEAPPSGNVSGGYAAALMRPAAPTPVSTTKVVSQKPRQQPQSHSKKPKDSAKKVIKGSKQGKIDDERLNQHDDQPSVTVRPPVWGHGRSFADIVSA